MNLLKTHWPSFVILGLFVWGFVFNKPGCNNNNSSTGSKRDTVVTSHTEFIQGPTQYVDRYIPVSSGNQQPVIIPQPYQPSTNYEQLIKQYNDLANKFLSITTYKDSIPLKDSLGNRVGVVNLEDAVSENQIKFRKPSYTLAFPHTYTVNNITYTKGPKFQLYYGLGLTGNQVQFVNGGNIGVLVKSRKEQIYQLNAGIINYNGLYKPQFGIGSYFKLSFGKK